MKVGYVRTSTTEQKLDRQLIQMKELGVEKIFQEQQSGKDTKRLEFQKMLKYIRKNDELIVSSLDRLGRNYSDVKNTIKELKEKGVKIKIIDAPFLELNTGNRTLDLAMYDMLISLLGYIAENEREKILERQKQGISLAKEKGVYKGRPIKYSEDSKNAKDRIVFQQVRKMLEENKPVRGIAKYVGIASSTVYEIKKRIQL